MMGGPEQAETAVRCRRVGPCLFTTPFTRLCKDILAGRVLGAIKMQMDEDNFGLTNVAAGAQMRQIGKDQEPIDLSKTENLEAFKKDMGTWFQGLSQDAKMEKYGFIDLESAQAAPYGAPAAASA